LTQAFSWRAIFVAQVPLPLVAAALRKAWFTPASSDEEPAPRPARPLLVLGLVSAALTALLFGVVLLLVVGWAMHPLAAALAVSIVPVAALAGALVVRGDPATRVAVGSGLIGGGIAALAFLPSDDVAWLVLPECVAGFGMGLALTPLIEDLLPERTHDARALNLAVRHLGITLALVALAPVIHHDLDAAVERAKLQSVGVVLVAPIGPREKISEDLQKWRESVVTTLLVSGDAATLQTAAEQLKRERDAVELDLRANVGSMSATLASRILGVEVAPVTAAASSTSKSGR